MTTQVPNNPGQQYAGAGNPATPTTPTPDGQGAAGAQTGGAGQGFQYLTIPELERRLEQERQAVRRELERFRDSTTDRTANRVKEIVQQAAERGQTITNEQAAAVLEAIEGQGQQQGQTGQAVTPPAQQPAASPASTSAQPAQPAQNGGGEGQPVDPVYQFAAQLLTEAGVTIDPEDPEYQTANKDAKTATEFLANLTAAINAKKERLSMAGDPARLPTLGGSPQQGNPIASIKDPTTLWRMATGQE